MNELVLMVAVCEYKNISNMKCADIEHTLSTAMAIQASSAPVEQKLLCVWTDSWKVLVCAQSGSVGYPLFIFFNDTVLGWRNPHSPVLQQH